MKRRHAIAAVAFVPLADLKGQPPSYFSTGDLGLIARLCSLILPADDASPAAGDTKVPWYIDRVIAHADARTKDLWKAGLAAVRTGVPENFLKDASRNEANPQTDTERFFVALKSLCLEAYLYSEAGRKYLGYKGSRAIPSFAGCEQN